MSGPCDQSREKAEMGPWREVNRSAESMAADAAADDDGLDAARNASAGRWDIIEVFGGFLAVPAGTPVVQATTLGGLQGKLNRQAEEE